MMAEGIRTGVEQARITGTRRIKASESISQAMFSILAYQKVAKHQPRYKTVERIDRYTVQGDDGQFSFELDAICSKKEPFVFAMAGDTSSDFANNIFVERFSRRENSWEKLSGEVKIEKHAGTPNGIILRCKAKELRHRYKITCLWGGVFREGMEYVYCPWVSTYGSVVRRYSLEYLHHEM